MSTQIPVVISSGSPPPGSAYATRETALSQHLLEHNGFAVSRMGTLRATESAHPALRVAAFHLLAEAPQAEDHELFLHGLHDREGAVRAWAAFGLERLSPGTGVPALRALAAESLQFAEYGPLVAAAALARLGDASGLPAMQAAMSNTNEPVAVVQRLYWFAALGRDELWPLYERALADVRPGVRPLALLQLRQLAEPQATAVLQRFAASLPQDSPEAGALRELLAERGAS